SWTKFRDDLNIGAALGLNRNRLQTLLKNYFDMEGLSCEWERVEEATDSQIVTCLSMICPFAPEEKQALLEAETPLKRAVLFMELIEFALKCGQGRTEALKTQH